MVQCRHTLIKSFIIFVWCSCNKIELQKNSIETHLKCRKEYQYLKNILYYLKCVICSPQKSLMRFKCGKKNNYFFISISYLFLLSLLSYIFILYISYVLITLACISPLYILTFFIVINHFTLRFHNDLSLINNSIIL